mmetsp:Transcript_27724/g.62750  ORF Transcript_27724/g.62750 Transcript_27724/m.62750 type:complete len:91 (+) Transcript_27724:331-603(+)
MRHIGPLPGDHQPATQDGSDGHAMASFGTSVCSGLGVTSGTSVANVGACSVHELVGRDPGAGPSHIVIGISHRITRLASCMSKSAQINNS